MIKNPRQAGVQKSMCRAFSVSGVSVFHFADAVLILTQFLRRHHPALVVQHYATHFISDMLRRLKHQLKVLQFVAIRRHLHENGHARRGEVGHFRVKGSRINHIRQAEQRRTTAVGTQVAVEDIHVAEFKARLLDTVEQDVAIQFATVMSGNVHDDYRFFTLRFFWRRGRRFFYHRFWLRLCYWLSRLECLRGRLRRWRSGLLNRLYLRRGSLLRLRRRLLRRGLRLNGLLRGRLRLNRLYRTRSVLRRHRRVRRRRDRLTRLRRRIRRLVLVLRRLARGFMLLRAAGGMIHAVNTNFTHAFVSVDIVVKRLIVAF